MENKIYISQALVDIEAVGEAVLIDAWMGTTIDFLTTLLKKLLERLNQN
jgi:hypothetical protein